MDSASSRRLLETHLRELEADVGVEMRRSAMESSSLW